MGYGTVGSGVVEVINTNGDIINQRAGDEINIKYVLDIRDFPGDPVQEKIVHDIDVIINDPEIKIVVEVMGGIEPGRYLDYAWSGYCNGDEPVQIVDPWHQGEPNVSALHPRKPIAGLDASKYGCVHATWYTGGDKAGVESVEEWVKAGFSQSGITVYYDIRSIVQDKFESGNCWNPSYVLKAWFYDLRVGLDLARLNNKPGYPGFTYNQYNKWAKDW